LYYVKINIVRDCKVITISNRILDVLKSGNIIGLEASSCKNARPLAAPIAIFILIGHVSRRVPAHTSQYNLLIQ